MLPKIKKRVTLELSPYYKRGADFAEYAERCGDNAALAVQEWANGLRKAADALATLAGFMRERSAEVRIADADTHVAWVDVPEEVAAKVAAEASLAGIVDVREDAPD